MSPRPLIRLAVLAFGAIPLAAQVAPSAYTSTEGPSYNVFLFGRANLVRIMDVYRTTVLPGFYRGRSIKGLALRTDARNATTAYRAKRLSLELDISSSLLDPAYATRSFDEFHGYDRKKVIDKVLYLPYQPATTSPSPRAFNVDLPFNAPWLFDYHPKQEPEHARSLVLDYKVPEKHKNNAEYVLDGTGFCRSTATKVGLGEQCFGSRGKRVTLTATTANYAGSNVVYTLQGALANADLLLSLAFGPVPITPLELAAGSACYANFAPQTLQPGKANKYGKGLFKYPIPRRSDLVGLDIHAQGAALDVNANAFGYVTTRGLSTKVCGPLDVCQLMALNDGHKAKVAQSNVYGLAHVVQFK